MRFGLLALGLLGSLTAHADGAVWAVRGEKNTVYLAGSVHALRAGDATLPDAIETAYRDAEAIVMEIDLDDVDEVAMQQWLLEHGTFRDGRTLRMALGEKRYERAAEAAQRLGLPIEGLQMFEPWAVAMTLMQLELTRLGLDPQIGVEKQLERRAAADRKEILGLETAEQQLGILDALGEADQARFLELTVEEAEEMPRQLDALLRAWRNGDTAALEALLLAEYRAFPSLFGPLVTERNRRWIPRILALLDDERDYLVVVGALHLVGSEGVLALLARKGHSARPLQ
jgi:hypothetical protein